MEYYYQIQVSESNFRFYYVVLVYRFSQFVCLFFSSSLVSNVMWVILSIGMIIPHIVSDFCVKFFEYRARVRGNPSRKK